MTDYLLGLFTIPAMAGVVAAAYGLYRAGWWLLDHSPLIRMPLTDTWRRANAGAAVSAVRTVWGIKVSEYVNIWFAFGPVDVEMYKKNRKALEHRTPAPRITEKWEDIARRGGEQ